MIFLNFLLDKQFDVPDRTFHAIETTWNLSSFASAPDVKELIPEFFFLPEFLQNSEGKKWTITRLYVELCIWLLVKIVIYQYSFICISY